MIYWANQKNKSFIYLVDSKILVMSYATLESLKFVLFFSRKSMKSFCRIKDKNSGNKIFSIRAFTI